MSSVKVVPSEEDLLEALDGLVTSEPALGFKKVFQKLREQHPDWEVDNPAKERLRKAFREDRDRAEVEAAAAAARPAGEDSEAAAAAVTPASLTTPASPAVAPPYERYSSNASTWSSAPPVPHPDSASIAALHASMPGYYSNRSSRRRANDLAAEPGEVVVDQSTLIDIMRRYNAMSKRRPRNGYPDWPALMSPDLLLALMRPGRNDISIPKMQNFTNDPYYLPHKMFWVEWNCFIGPHRDEECPPPVPFVPNEELTRFVTLFPYGQGAWRGPTGHPTPITFEEYAARALQLADPRFRHSQEWLEWVLTRTEDLSLMGSINCALVLFFDSKARHLGKGKIERKAVEENFTFRQLRDGELV